MTSEALWASIERALDELPRDVYGELLPRLRLVVAHNFERGRVARFQARNANQSAAAYVLNVAETMRQQGDTPARLAAGAEREWQALGETMAARAYHRLIAIGIPPEIATERARDLAQKTCLDILEAQPYPYDVPYVAWATRILYNSIAHETQRSRDVLDRRDRLPLERWPTDDGEIELIDPQTQDEAEQSDLRQTVAWALAQLSPKQRAAVVRRVYEGAPDRLTALELDSSEQAVQNHRHRGVQRLRQLLAAT